MRTSPLPRSFWSRSVARVVGKVFGGTCYLCRGASSGAICADCRAEMPSLSRPRCPRCALPNDRGALCGRCLGDPPAYDATCAAFAYAFPADVLVQGLKFRGELGLAPLLAACLQTEIPREAGNEVDVLMPVPLHDLRLRERGFNHSLEIARPISAAFGLPLDALACERVRNTEPQLGLPWKARRENMRGAFSCRKGLEGKRVAVIDDVMTTGATLNEMAATLKRFGATRVVNWVVARTPPD